MSELSKNIHIIREHKPFLILLVISIFSGLLSFLWQFWLLLGFVAFLVAIVYFSREFRNIMDIHVVALSFIILQAVPSSVLILQDEIVLNNNEKLMLFSSMAIGIIGYIVGVLFCRKLFLFDKRQKETTAKKINALFWRTYGYRHIIAIIAIIIILFKGFMPFSVSYNDSVNYRMEVPGVLIYLNSLFSEVFSVYLVTIICVIGDMRLQKKFSMLSYLFIALTLVSIIGGHRIWIIGLIALLIIVFQPYFKRRNILLILISAFLIVFLASGAVRFARKGSSVGENIYNLNEYFINLKSLNDIFWGFSDLTVPFSTFITIIKNVPENIPFDISLYWKDFNLFVPTVIYPNRPLPIGEWYVKTFEPEIYENGGGLTFYVIGYGYLFAGAIGVLFHLFIWGGIFELINKYFRMIGGAAALFLYSYFFLALFSFVRDGEIFAFIKTSVLMYFAVPVIVLFSIVVLMDAIKFKRIFI